MAAVAAGILSIVAIAIAAAHDDHSTGEWPTSCVDLNDIVEEHLGRLGNVGIYQRTFGDQAEAACQNDHRNDVRSVFAWAIGAGIPSPPTTTVDTTDPETWRGLVVASEDRCSPYDPDDYPYSQSAKQQIVANMGGIIYDPYTVTWFDSTSQTDIEYIVARSEGHDSGLCAASAETKRQFASDLLNLTLAGPTVNRHQKSGYDAAEWLPDQNRCWFANRVVEIRQRYGLTVDQHERDALERVLSGCASTEMVVQSSPTQIATPAATPGGGPTVDALQLYDDNGNGRITCAEARRHGIAPVRSDHPAYPYMNDRDNDGIVCE